MLKPKTTNDAVASKSICHNRTIQVVKSIQIVGNTVSHEKTKAAVKTAADICTRHGRHRAMCGKQTQAV